MTKRKDDSNALRDILWSMRSVSQRTGLSEHTLRAWEKRFGFPNPVRLPSGHRRYPADQVRRLAAIQAALVRGHRIGDVIDLDEGGIDALLASDTLSGGGPEPAEGTYLDACLRLDADGLASMMRRDAAALGISRFLQEKAGPFVQSVGDSWADGVMTIGHEHLSTEVVEGVLRELRAPLERGLSGRPVLLATLPGEQHSLGLQMAALMIVARGVRVRVLGLETPPAEIARVAVDLRAGAVALSLTEAGVGAGTTGEIAVLRDALPKDISLWLGGRGALRLRGLPADVRVAATLDDIDDLVSEVRARA
jgi:MerR family transcriptional regulator, light-induced transcriptional regulator